jgi:hypothetical protein
MSRLDDLANDAPIPTPVSAGGPIPEPGQPAARNAFTDVTITQQYFFMWKWLAASILFALPFWILGLLIGIISHR